MKYDCYDANLAQFWIISSQKQICVQVRIITKVVPDPEHKACWDMSFFIFPLKYILIVYRDLYIQGYFKKVYNMVRPAVPFENFKWITFEQYLQFATSKVKYYLFSMFVLRPTSLLSELTPVKILIKRGFRWVKDLLSSANVKLRHCWNWKLT